MISSVLIYSVVRSVTSLTTDGIIFFLNITCNVGLNKRQKICFMVGNNKDAHKLSAKAAILFGFKLRYKL